jgi:phosphonate transport system ATP-binding protein
MPYAADAVPAAPCQAVASLPDQLRTESLSVAYPDGTLALQRASLTFARGQFTVLLGASGAGKSTLLRCLNGLVRPTAGRVIAPGIGDMAHPRALRRHRRQTGMVFQQHHLIGRLTVLSNVLTGRLGYRSALGTLLPWSRAEQTLALAALERVGMLEHALKRADQLSGGQQQRVGVARALVQAPRIVLADEPVASLDPATAARLLEMLHGICKTDRITAVVSLHQVQFARRFADRIVGLAHGTVIFDGSPAQLTDDIVALLYGAPSPRALREALIGVANRQHSPERAFA